MKIIPMSTNTELTKIDKALCKISSKELKDFAQIYASTHEDFAIALIEKYWKPERGNYKEMVEACFAHVSVLGKQFGQPCLDWRKIENDLAAVMRKATGMKRKGNLIDAALIAGFVLTTTCREFEHDHQDYEPVRYDDWAEENTILKDIVTDAADMVRELLIAGNGIEEDSKLGILGEIAERCEEIGDNYFIRLSWFVDDAMPLICGEDEKVYMAHISKRLKNKKENYFHYRYVIQKADYWITHGKRSKAEKLMMDKREDEHVRDHYIDCLTEWREYRKAVEIIDDNRDSFKAAYCKWEEKLVNILKLSEDREWLIDECRRRCITGNYKMKYYEALKDAISKDEWKGFMVTLWDEIDWELDYEDAEIKIAVKEKMTDHIKDFFAHSPSSIWDKFPKYVKFIPKKDLKFVGGIVIGEIKRLALLKKKPKEYAWLLERVEDLMGHSSIVDDVIKDGIKNMIAENPDNFYLRKYLYSVL